MFENKSNPNLVKKVVLSDDIGEMHYYISNNSKHKVIRIQFEGRKDLVVGMSFPSLNEDGFKDATIRYHNEETGRGWGDWVRGCSLYKDPNKYPVWIKNVEWTETTYNAFIWHLTGMVVYYIKNMSGGKYRLTEVDRERLLELSNNKWFQNTINSICAYHLLREGE